MDLRDVDVRANEAAMLAVRRPVVDGDKCALTLSDRQLEMALHDSESNAALVSRKLGSSRVTVYQRMERLGISRIRRIRFPKPHA